MILMFKMLFTIYILKIHLLTLGKDGFIFLFTNFNFFFFHKFNHNFLNLSHLVIPGDFKMFLISNLQTIVLFLS